MNHEMQTGMAEATRLTREGRLAEATALIQRTLGGGMAFPASKKSEDGEVIEAVSRVVDEAPRPAAPSRPARHDLRRAPAPERPHRGEPPRFGDTSGAPMPAETAAGGRFVERSYSNRAGTRGYKLYVPGGYVGQEVSLVVMLHGCTQDPDDFAAGTRMNALAEERTFLVAYPAQSRNANMQGCWNWFGAGDQGRGQGEPSIIAGITREVLGEYNVDTGRVYVAGMSAGGAMAAIMGSAYPDLYAAVGIHSGLAPGAASDLSSAFSAMRGTARRGARPTRSAPAIIFHGDRDSTVHPKNADDLSAHFQVADGDAPPVRVRRGQVPGGHAYSRAVHHDAKGSVVAERWTVHGLGHAWSGGGAGSYTDHKGPDASAEMVRFFDERREPADSPVERGE